MVLHESLLPNWQQSVDEVIFPHLSKKRKKKKSWIKVHDDKKKHAQILILLPFIILCQVCAKGEKNSNTRKSLLLWKTWGLWIHNFNCSIWQLLSKCLSNLAIIYKRSCKFFFQWPYPSSLFSEIVWRSISWCDKSFVEWLHQMVFFLSEFFSLETLITVTGCKSVRLRYQVTKYYTLLMITEAAMWMNNSFKSPR